MDALKFQILGPSNGTALVCLHGFLGSGSDCFPFAQELQRLRPDIQILLPDLPGHGESVTIPLQNFTARLCETLDAAQISRTALAGYSLGGRLALAAAIEHPHRFPALIGISTTAGIENPGERKSRCEADAKLARLRALAAEWRRSQDGREGPLRIDAIGVRQFRDGTSRVTHVQGIGA